MRKQFIKTWLIVLLTVFLGSGAACSKASDVAEQQGADDPRMSVATSNLEEETGTSSGQDENAGQPVAATATKAPTAAVNASSARADTVAPAASAPAPPPATASASSPATATAPDAATAKVPGAATQKSAQSCTISIECLTLLDQMDKLEAAKRSLVPADGILLRTQKIEFKPGDTAFDVLKRVTKEKKIHMSFVKTPALNSYYVEGIANLYEFDCGPTSGWLYQINGKTMGIGSSNYKLKDGDQIAWKYTCELGDL